MWPILVVNRLFIRKEYFNELVERLHQVPQKVTKAIGRDLDRTLMPESNVINTGVLKEDLMLLLCLYHLHRPDISYVQGMIYPMALLLCNLDKFEAFRCFCNIMASEFVNVLFCFDLQNVSLYCRVFDELLMGHDRKLAEHLRRLNICSEGFIVEWFYTFFCRRFKYDALCKMWDLFLVYSYRVFFRLSVVILAKLKPRLLGLAEYQDALEVITSWNDHLDEAELLKGITELQMRSSDIADAVERVKEKDRAKDKNKPKQ